MKNSFFKIIIASMLCVMLVNPISLNSFKWGAENDEFLTNDIGIDAAIAEWESRNGPLPTRSSSSSSTPSTPAHTHDYTSAVTKEPTCSEEGVKTYTCSGCGKTYTESIPKTEHVWVETVVTPATCSTEGEVKKVCSICGEEVVEHSPIDPEVHDYEEVVITEATCTIDGKGKKVCKNCGAETDEYAIPAIGHAYNSTVTKEPTCTENGVRTYTCLNCGDTYTEEIEAFGHDEASEYVYKAKIGDMVFDGKTVYTCQRCGAVREEADATSYPYMLLIGVVAVITIIIVSIIAMIVIKKVKKR